MLLIVICLGSPVLPEGVADDDAPTRPQPAEFAIFAGRRPLAAPSIDAPPAAVRPVLDQWDLTGDERGWKFVIVHHSATKTGSVESIDRAHRQRRDARGNPWRGIGYHFVIGNGQGMDDGEVRPTFRWTEQASGAHAGIGNFNEYGVGICLIGNFEDAPPTEKQLAAVRKLIMELRTEYGINRDAVLSHRDVRATACPGEHLNLDAIAGPEQVIMPTSAP
ncbi:MAG: peptidoglycan recognition family protein [Planctomycetaceae bacterium]